MSAASREQMELMHATLAKRLGDYLDTTARPSAAMIGQIRRFLKDNGIEVAKGGLRAGLRKAEVLPFPN